MSLLVPVVQVLAVMRRFWDKRQEIIKLVPVNSQKFFVSYPPDIDIIYFRTGERGKNFCEVFVVVSHNPAHLSGFGKLREKREEFPIITSKAVEIEIFKNISEQDQFLELEVFQEFSDLFGATHPRSQMQIGNDEGMGFVFLFLFFHRLVLFYHTAAMDALRIKILALRGFAPAGYIC